MIGYEALVRVEAAPSWGSVGTLGHRGIFLFADSVRPNFGAVVHKRDNKLTGNRESSGSTYSVDQFNQSCEVTWQPRADDILPFVLAHMQNGTGLAGGTYEFTRIGRNLTFTTNGSNIGTHPYSINLDVFLGNSLIGGGTGANGYRFFNGIVDKLTFALKYGDDLKCTAMIKFQNGSRFNYPAAFNVTPSGLGSFSAYPLIVDYMGTVNIVNETLPVDDLEISYDNAVAERSVIGSRGWNRFPLAKHWVAGGRIGMEFARDLNELAEGTTNTGTFEFCQQVGVNHIQNIFHNFFFDPVDPEVTDGETVVDINLPFRGYPTTTSGTSSIVRVYTGTLFGSLLFNFTGIQ